MHGAELSFTAPPATDNTQATATQAVAETTEERQEASSAGTGAADINTAAVPVDEDVPYLDLSNSSADEDIYDAFAKAQQDQDAKAKSRKKGSRSATASPACSTSSVGSKRQYRTRRGTQQAESPTADTTTAK